MDDSSRDWRRYWRSASTANSAATAEALKQVGKTLLGSPVDDSQLDLIVDRIGSTLNLSTEDRVLDLGCGNGLLTESLQSLVAFVHGYDISEPLITDARAYRMTTRTSYEIADLVYDEFLHDPASTATKAYSYEVFQHFTPAEADRFLAYVNRSSAVDKLLVGSVPDRDRIREFYDTAERWNHYLDSIETGTEQIGTWWVAPDLVTLAERNGFTCSIIDQPADLYTAHYRFDALLTRRHDHA